MSFPFMNNWKLSNNYTQTIFNAKHNYYEYPPNIEIQSFLLNKQGVKFADRRNKYFDNEQQMVEKYSELYDKKKECFKVKYALPEHRWGRVIPVGGLSLSLFHRPTRHAVCDHEYIDLDFVNAQPDASRNICKQNNFPTPYLDDYCENREDKISEIKRIHNVDRGEAKNLFISIMFGGSYNKWIEDASKRKHIANAVLLKKKPNTTVTFVVTNKRLQWIKLFEDEQETIRDIVYANNKHIIDDVDKSKPDKFTLTNYKTAEGIIAKKKRTCMALWLQTIERYLQEICIKYLIMNRKFELNKVVPCQDGFMIVKNLWYDGILEECNKVIENRMGFRIELVKKDFDEAIIIPLHEDACKVKDLEYTFADVSKYMDASIFEICEKRGNAGTNCLAKYISKKYGNIFACSDIKNNVWYEFSNHRWHECDAGYKIREIIYNDFRNDIEIILDKMRPNLKDEKAIKKPYEILYIVYEKLSNTGDLNNIMTELKTFLYKPNFENKLDSTSSLLCCSNGVFDFSKGIFRDGEPDDMCSLSTNIPYLEKHEIDDVDVRKLQNFMKQIFQYDDQRHYMECHLASSLLGRPNINQTFNNYLGSGANGKSTLVELMSLCIGEYFGMVPASLMTEARVKIGNASPEIADLKGKRYAVINEPSKGDKINEGMMKELTGDKFLRGRQLYHKPVTFEIMFNLVVCTNNLMLVDSDENGTWRRIRVIDFMSVFTDTPDKNDEHQFKRQSNLDLKSLAIPMLSFLIDIAMKTGGKVSECAMVTKSSNSYKDDQDKIGKFIKECIIKSDGESISKVALSAASNDWFIMNYNLKIKNTVLFDIMNRLFDTDGCSYYNIELRINTMTEYKSKETIFIDAFNLRFKVTRNMEDRIKTNRISEWAILQSLSVNSSKTINPILHEHYQLDVTKHSKLLKVNGIAGRYWIGIMEIPDVTNKKINQKNKV